MRRLALLAMVIVLPACSGSTGAAPGSGANVAAVIAPSLDRSDQPSFANRTLSARPMPFDAPVMIATFPSSNPIRVSPLNA